ncbi:MAG: NnrU family protein [Myxococcota bacterium]
MLKFGLGLLLFFGAHFYSAFRSRDPETELPTLLGRNAYRGGYSLVAAIGLAGIIFGFGETRMEPLLYTTPSWARKGAFLLMLPALTLIAAAYLPSGHLRNRLRHPMLIGVGLFALAHLMTGANGPKLMLFGLFLAFSVIDFAAAEKRSLIANSALTKRAPALSMDFAALVLGALAYTLVLLSLHQHIIGIDLLSG